MPYIYKITNKLNNKSYIGKTTLSINERWKQHCSDYKRRRNEKRPLYSAMEKYGIENFEIEEVEECSFEKVDEREIFWIEFFDTFSNGYNATRGGDGKFLIDRTMVLQLYQIHQNTTTVAKELNVCVDSIRNILRELNVPIISCGEIAAKKYGKAVIMKDLENNFIAHFLNQADTARWLINNNKTENKNISKVSYAIGRVVNGKRKTAFGYLWERMED